MNYIELIIYRNEIQMLLKTNPIFVYESTYAESIELLYKICRGAQRGPCQNIEFIYPGNSIKDHYVITNY